MALPHNTLFTHFIKTHFSLPSPFYLSEQTPPSILFNKKLYSKRSTASSSRWQGPRASAPDGPVAEASSKPAPPKLRILVAGGGIGGLVFALAAKTKGFDVMVFEKDLSTVRGKRQYRGPIQIQSNALAALEAIDLQVVEEVMSVGRITGDRINGLVDGLSGTCSKLEGRSLSCRLTDKANDMLQRWFEDDDAMERDLSGEWYLFPASDANGELGPIRLIKDEKRQHIIGSQSHAELSGMSIRLPFPQVVEKHARISCKDNAFDLTDLHSEHGTWITELFRVKVLKTLPEAPPNEGQQILHAV